MPPPLRPGLRRDARPGDAVAPLRRKVAVTAPASPLWRRGLHYLLLFVAVVLVADALVGEKGLVQSIRARKEQEQLTSTVERLRRENGQLREMQRRLREDPSAVESVAREELGLIRPGEVLVILKDARPVSE